MVPRYHMNGYYYVAVYGIQDVGSLQEFYGAKNRHMKGMTVVARSPWRDTVIIEVGAKAERNKIIGRIMDDVGRRVEVEYIVCRAQPHSQVYRSFYDRWQENWGRIPLPR